MSIELALKKLQDDFALVDAINKQSTSAYELLVKEYKPIKLKIDGNLNHKLPHIHVDYKNQYHTASYRIDTGARLVGTLPNKYDKMIKTWIGENRATLLRIWNAVRSDCETEEFVTAIKNSAFD